MSNRAKIYILLISFIMLFFVFPLQADHFTHLFEQGNKAYEEGNYKEAIKKYEEILDNRYESWELYYNLGNSYYKEGKIGLAVLNYERAKQLQPDNEDINFNLKLANLRVIDKIQTPPQFFLFEFYETVKNIFSINTLSVIVIISYITLISLLIVLIIARIRIFRGLIKAATYVVAVIVILISLTLYAKVHDKNQKKYGIILATRINVYSSPDENGTEVFSLHEGAKFQLQRDINEWAQIRLSDGKTGWLKRDSFEII